MKSISYSDIVLQILTIINYQNDKEKFIGEFEMLNRFDAIASVIDTYPAEFKEKIKDCKNKIELRRYVSFNDYKEAYIHISQKALQEFVASVVSTISLEQKEKIVQLVASF